MEVVGVVGAKRHERRCPASKIFCIWATSGAAPLPALTLTCDVAEPMRLADGRGKVD